ncbi:SGNH/GDSL hydrolase family protein [Microlunatus sp. Gsoil 973]|uniref:SGNH/GDSL hydrolase family protein n=1 Tax=Microlunatus sp. Gsoil 973 TaxID=2672569 RepID=UPI0018A87D2B|nr:SGNH/GDSL hydrolase family protein [Microlunatus sp. Gsoil 973]
MRTFHRYVAIGDSATEGLQDFDENGAYRGWADRLAEHIAAAQDQPLEYANLAVRSLRLSEIRRTQFDRALALEPDLMSIVGGVNDVLAPRPDFGRLAVDFDYMFTESASRGITVFTFLMPDPSFLKPIGRYVRERSLILSDITRAAAQNAGVLVLELARYPVASDPRLWYEDRLHGNRLGHQRMAEAFADLLGYPGFDHWADPLPDPLPQPPVLERIAGDLDWAVRWFGPWLGRGLAHVPHGQGITAKRPNPEVVAVTRHALSTDNG